VRKTTNGQTSVSVQYPIVRQRRTFIVEGYEDTLSHQWGYKTKVVLDDG